MLASAHKLFIQREMQESNNVFFDNNANAGENAIEQKKNRDGTSLTSAERHDMQFPMHLYKFNAAASDIRAKTKERKKTPTESDDSVVFTNVLCENALKPRIQRIQWLGK